MTTTNNQQLQEINAVTLKKWLDKKGISCLKDY